MKVIDWWMHHAYISDSSDTIIVLSSCVSVRVCVSILKSWKSVLCVRVVQRETERPQTGLVLGSFPD